MESQMLLQWFKMGETEKLLKNKLGD